MKNADFYHRLHQASLPLLPAILRRVLPNGKVEGNEYIALNPRRADSRLGSFKINLRTGRWADFAANITGGDATSLIAYVQAVSQSEAAHILTRMIGRAL